jgi:transcriptional regulator with XRE-family HTH domain
MNNPSSSSSRAKKVQVKPSKTVVAKKVGVARKNKHNVNAAPLSKDAPSALMSKLWEQAALNNESVTELAVILDISYPYLMALARGERPTDKIDRVHLEKAAKYLNLPVGQVYLLAGVLTPEDFIFEPTKDEKMQHALKAMRNDPLWAAHTPSKKVWQETPPSVQLLICLLYERAARTSFFDETEAPVYPDKR